MGKASRRRDQRVAGTPPASSASAASFLLSPWFFPAAALIATLAAFGPVLGGGFVFDDYNLVFNSPGAIDLPAHFWIGGSRPITYATYWANLLLSGTAPFAYHLTGLLLHTCISLLVFIAARRLFEIAKSPVDSRTAAWLCAGLFLLHPLQTESVDYVAGRSELVAGLFVFAAWAVFLRGFDTQTGFLRTIAILVLSGLGLLGKESAICCFALLLLTDILLRQTTIATQLRRRWILYSLFLVGSVAAAARILSTLAAGGGAGIQSGVRPAAYALTQCRVIPTYVRLFLAPFGQSIDWGLPFYRSPFDGLALAWILIFAAGVVGAVRLYRYDRLAGFGVAFFFVALLPTSSVIPIKDALAERRVYIPIFGLAVSAVSLGAKLIPARWNRYSAIAALTLCAVLSYARSTVWTTDLALWTDAVEKNPANGRAHMGMGTALMRKSDCVGALREFKAARSLDPSDNQLLWNIATATQCAGNLPEALKSFRDFAAIQPTSTAFTRIGFLEANAGNVQPALNAFDQALKLDNGNAEAHAYRGLARFATDNLAGAETDYRDALRIDPSNKVAATGLANLNPPPK